MAKKQTLLNQKPCQIRALFEYASKRKAEIGEDNVFDFSIGSPSSPLPEKAKQAIIDLLNEKDPVKLHGYSSPVSGDLTVREVVAKDLENRFGVEISPKLMHLTCGASAALAGVFSFFVTDEKSEGIIFLRCKNHETQRNIKKGIQAARIPFIIL